MPTAFQALLKDDGSGGVGGLLTGKHEFCDLSYDPSDEPTEVIVLVKNDGDNELSTEQTLGASKSSGLSLTDDKSPVDVPNGSSQPMIDKSSSPSKKMPALGVKGKLFLSSNNSKGTSKENASPQQGTNRGSLAALGSTKAALFASGGGSEGQFGTNSVSTTASVINYVPHATTKQVSSDIESEKVPAKKRSKKMYCSREGCANKAYKGGLCQRHGEGRKLCSWEGCTNQSQRGGLCRRHGAKLKRCSSEGCTNKAVKGGVCVRHGATQAKKRCSSEGCTKHAEKGGVCWKHGAKDLKKSKCMLRKEVCAGSTGRRI